MKTGLVFLAAACGLLRELVVSDGCLTVVEVFGSFFFFSGTRRQRLSCLLV
jgi:hypothetical protein